MTPELAKEILLAHSKGHLQEVFWSGWQISTSITLDDYATSVVEYEGKYYKLRHSREIPWGNAGITGEYRVAEPTVVCEVVKRERSVFKFIGRL